MNLFVKNIPITWTAKEIKKEDQKKEEPKKEDPKREDLPIWDLKKGEQMSL